MRTLVHVFAIGLLIADPTLPEFLFGTVSAWRRRLCAPLTLPTTTHDAKP